MSLLETTAEVSIALAGFVGIFLAFVLFVFVYILYLKGILLLFSNLIQVVLIGLIVLFQPEIMKVFDRAESFR